MKAIVQDKYGSPEVLELRAIDKPEIADDEVLVRIRAAGANPADWAIMSGLPYIARPVYGLRKPKNSVRGTDVTGTVEALGTGVTRLQPGDEVANFRQGEFLKFRPTRRMCPSRLAGRRRCRYAPSRAARFVAPSRPRCPAIKQG
jgi:NADPH:quinone reductase-like Zn-dependent oxidoreductase